MVTGGTNDDTRYLQSAEIHVEGTGIWQYIEPLPLPIKFHKALTVDNVVYLTGDLLAKKKNLLHYKNFFYRGRG